MMKIWILILALIYSVDGQTECNDAMKTCGSTMYASIGAATDNTARCTAVDTALACVITGTFTCDLMARADINTAMNDIINIYQNGDTQCTLAFASDAAFTDPCLTQLSYCSNIYYEAEYTPSTIQACGGFDNYKVCMATNTTACTETATRDVITEAINNATSAMDSDPYYCFERDSYDIAACETGFYTCLDPLASIGTAGIDTSSTVCAELDTFSQCMTANNINCSPRLAELYQNNADNLTTTFQGDPYYCGADNPCFEAFKGCNQTEHDIQVAQECGLVAVYEACMETVSAICDADKLTLTTPLVDALIQEVVTNFQCSTSTTTTSNNGNPTTTTAQSGGNPTTTTSQNGGGNPTTTSSQNGGANPTTTGSQNGGANPTTTSSQNGGNINAQGGPTPKWNYGGSATSVTSSLMTMLLVMMTSQYL